MSQRLSWSIEDLEPETRDAALRAARRAGISVDDWLDMTMRDQESTSGHSNRSRSQYGEYDDEPVERDLSMMSRGRTDTASYRFAPSRLSPDEAEVLLERAAASDRRARDADSRTAEMLESITRWMEKTETRLMANERNSSQQQERTASVVAEAIKTVGTRLNEVERRKGDERRAFPELRSVPDRRVAPHQTASGGTTFSKANFADAVAEIRARQRDLEGAGQTQPLQAQPRYAERPDMRSADPGIKALREELRALGSSFNERTTNHASQDDVRAELLKLRKEISQGAVRSNTDMMSTVSALITKLDKQGLGGSDQIGRSIARLESDMAKLASGRGAGGDAMERQIARLHQRLDQMGLVSDGKTIGNLSRELSEIKTRLGDDIGQRIASMAGELTALRRTQIDPNELIALRTALQESSAKPARDVSDEFGVMLRQIESLSHKIETLPGLDVKTIDNRFNKLFQRLDEPLLSYKDDALAGKIDNLLNRLDEMSSHAPAGIESRLDALQAAFDRNYEQADPPSSPALERQIEMLGARLENLAASNGLVQILASDGKPATADLRPIEKMLQSIHDRVNNATAGDQSTTLDQISQQIKALGEKGERAHSAPDLSPIEAMLHTLQERFDKAQQPDAGSNAISALEKQIGKIAKRIDEWAVPASDTNLDNSLRELVKAVEALRHDGPSLTERAVKAAIENGQSHLKAAQSGIENRITSSFTSVNSTMERIASRLAALEANHHAPRQTREDEVPGRMTSGVSPRDVNDRNVLIEERSALAEAMLLEPTMQIAQASKAAQASQITSPRPKIMPPERKVPEVAMQTQSKAEVQRIEPVMPAPHIAAFAEPVYGAAGMMLDQPLEPGSGRPRTGGTRPPANQTENQSSTASGDTQTIKANYIAAARRAVQAAAAEAKAVAGDERSPKSSKIVSPSKLKALFEKRKKPILLGLAAAILALGSAQVISSAVFGGKEPLAEAKLSTVAPEKARLTASTARPAGGNAAKDRTTQKIDIAAANVPLPPAVNAVSSALPLQRVENQAPVGAQVPAAALPSAPNANPPQIQLPSAGTGPDVAIAAIPADVSSSAAPPPLAGVAVTVTGLPEIPSTFGSAGLRKAAMSGDPRAVFDLATRMADGRGMQREPKLALKLLERAAAAGLVPAQFRIGNMYEKGIGTTKDAGLARLWYERAAEKGNSKAMHNLAVLYAEGVTGKPDYPVAAEWFRKAAEHGVRDSQYNLAILLARGLGAAQDLTQSYTWFAVASSQGDDDAGKKRDEVALKLSPTELAAARQSFERWRAKPVELQANEVALPAKGWDEPVASPANQKKTARNSQG